MDKKRKTEVKKKEIKKIPYEERHLEMLPCSSPVTAKAQANKSASSKVIFYTIFPQSPAISSFV